MKNETKSNVKSDIASGVGSSIGATIGMVVGSSLSAEANAAEVPVHPITPERPNVISQTTVSEPSVTPHVVPMDNPVVEEHEPEIEILGYETVSNDDGSQMDVAIVSVDGQEAVIADLDMDGTADVIAADLNGDGSLDDGEFADVSGQGIAMATFQDATGMTDDSTLLAQNEDYVNDADVNDFMA